MDFAPVKVRAQLAENLTVGIVCTEYILLTDKNTIKHHTVVWSSGMT
jgi:hypothetical protein